jgi:phage baseplate assembly protein V
MNDAFAASDMGRRLETLIAYGVITEVDLDARSAFVRIDGDDSELVAGPLPWLEARHGLVRSAFAPSIGEAVVVLCPSGDPAAGVILGGLPHDQIAAPWAGTKTGFDFGSGGRWTHDVDGGVSRFEAPTRIELVVGSSMVTITASAITLKADTIRGDGAVLLGPAGLARDVARKGDPVAGGVITAGSASVKSS